MVYNEVIVSDCYAFDSWVPSRKPRFIFDIGANIGCFSSLAASKYPECTVIGYELMKVNFKRAKEHISKFSNAECKNEIVCGKNKPVGVFVHPSNAGGSKPIFKGDSSYISEERFTNNNWRRYSNEDNQAISTNFLDIFDEYKVDYIDFLKLDCEGSEHEILTHLIETGYIDRVKNISMEIHGSGEEERRFILSELKNKFDSHSQINNIAHYRSVNQ
jgi:FkbM family methyltransferase